MPSLTGTWGQGNYRVHGLWILFIHRECGIQFLSLTMVAFERIVDETQKSHLFFPTKKNPNQQKLVSEKQFGIFLTSCNIVSGLRCEILSVKKKTLQCVWRYPLAILFWEPSSQQLYECFMCFLFPFSKDAPGKWSEEKSMERNNEKPIIWPSWSYPLDGGVGITTKSVAVVSKQSISKRKLSVFLTHVRFPNNFFFNIVMNTKVFPWNSITLRGSLMKAHRL